MDLKNIDFQSLKDKDWIKLSNNFFDKDGRKEIKFGNPDFTFKSLQGISNNKS